MIEKDIDVLVMQEVELEKDFDCNLLNIPGYRFESENNNFKKRIGVYIRDSIKYKWCAILEGHNSHIVVMDLVKGKKNKKIIINIYRSFNPNGESAKDLYVRKISLIKNALNNDTVIMGDFNIDYNRWFDMNYQKRDYFEMLEEKLGELHLMQLVTFDTWSSLVGLVLRSYLLDHICYSPVT